jgi:FdhD protein
MGEDKAFLDWKGRPLFAIQLEKLFDHGDEVLLSANADQAFPDYIENVRIIRDTAPDIGPLGAFRDCLAATADSGAEYLLVLGVDLPSLTIEFLHDLIEKVEATGKGIVPKINDRWDPLAAVFPSTALALVESLIGDGHLSLQRFCDRAEADGLIEELSGVDPDLFVNLNTRDDYDRLQQGQFDRPTLLNRYQKGKGFREANDRLAAEEPLEVRVEGKSIAVVMRTPGHDDELAAGFLLTESAISSADDLFEISKCRDVTDPEAAGNVLDVKLAPNHHADLEALTRHVFTSSSCGVCGKATIESVFQNFPVIESNLTVSPETLLSLSDKLRKAQDTFEKTGGLHASALFSPDGDLLLLREDVGRHNALDKVIGRSVLDGNVPLSDRILLVSGRISFELVQKALAAGIPIIAGISAPSSLAVEFAEKSGQTLVGFLRERGFNVYTGAHRVSQV